MRSLKTGKCSGVDNIPSELHDNGDEATTTIVTAIWQKEWDEASLVSNKFYEILPTLPDKMVSSCNTRKENTVLNSLHIDHSYLTHSFILRKEEAPVRVACNAVITVKHFLIKCADLLEIRKKYLKEKSLYSFFRNVISVFFSWERLMCFTKYEAC